MLFLKTLSISPHVFMPLYGPWVLMVQCRATVSAMFTLDHVVQQGSHTAVLVFMFTYKCYYDYHSVFVVSTCEKWFRQKVHMNSGSGSRWSPSWEHLPNPGGSVFGLNGTKRLPMVGDRFRSLGLGVVQQWQGSCLSLLPWKVSRWRVVRGEVQLPFLCQWQCPQLPLCPWWWRSGVKVH